MLFKVKDLGQSEKVCRSMSNLQDVGLMSVCSSYDESLDSQSYGNGLRQLFLAAQSICRRSAEDVYRHDICQTRLFPLCARQCPDWRDAPALLFTRFFLFFGAAVPVVQVSLMLNFDS